MTRCIVSVVLVIALTGGILTCNPASDGLEAVPSALACELFGGTDTCIRAVQAPCFNQFDTQTCPWVNYGAQPHPLGQTMRVSKTKYCTCSYTCSNGFEIWDLWAAGCTPPPEESP